MNDDGRDADYQNIEDCSGIFSRQLPATTVLLVYTL